VNAVTVSGLGTVRHELVHPCHGGCARADGQDADEGYTGGPKERE